MDKIIKFIVKKEIRHSDELKIFKLKGNLISKGYTEIIHMADQDQDYYLNSFSISAEKKNEVENFVIQYLSDNNLEEIIILPGKNIS